MKRFKIKNLINGLEFQVVRETLEPLQPEWGKPSYFTERLVTPELTEVIVVSPEERDPETGEVTKPEVTEIKIIPAVYEPVQVPAEYTVVEEDITAELEAKKLKEDAKKQAVLDLTNIEWDKVKDAELKSIIQKLVQVVLGV